MTYFFNNEKKKRPGRSLSRRPVRAVGRCPAPLQRGERPQGTLSSPLPGPARPVPRSRPASCPVLDPCWGAGRLCCWALQTVHWGDPRLASRFVTEGTFPRHLTVHDWLSTDPRWHPARAPDTHTSHTCELTSHAASGPREGRLAWLWPAAACAPPAHPARAGKGGRATGRVGRHICGRNPEVGCRGHPSAGSFPITQLWASRGHSPSHPYYKLQSMDQEARRVSATGPEGQRAGLCARPPTAELRACGLVQSWDDSAASPPARPGACPRSDQPCDRSGQPGPERNLSNTWGGGAA